MLNVYCRFDPDDPDDDQCDDSGKVKTIEIKLADPLIFSRNDIEATLKLLINDPLAPSL